MMRLTKRTVSTPAFREKKDDVYLSHGYFGSYEGARKYDPHGSKRFQPCELSLRARTVRGNDEDPRRTRARRNAVATNVSPTSGSTLSKASCHPGGIRTGQSHV